MGSTKNLCIHNIAKLEVRSKSTNVEQNGLQSLIVPGYLSENIPNSSVIFTHK